MTGRPWSLGVRYTGAPDTAGESGNPCLPPDGSSLPIMTGGIRRLPPGKVKTGPIRCIVRNGSDREPERKIVDVQGFGPAANGRPLGGFVYGTEFHHRGKAAGRRAHRRTGAELSHRERGVAAEAVPRKSTPSSERNIRPGAGIVPRVAGPDRG